MSGGLLNWLRSVLPNNEGDDVALMDVYDVANARARAMFPPGAHKGVGDATDAARHALGAAYLARKFGERPAELLGRLYEAYSSSGTPEEEEMDRLNNALGARLGAQGLTRAQLEEAIRRAVGSGEARVLNRARGGLTQIKECGCG